MDLATLWYLTIGTLLVATAMTLWERQALTLRSRELGVWAAAYATFAVSCIVAMNRSALPGVTGAALSNVTVVFGHALVLKGVLALDGKTLRHGMLAGLPVVLGAAWIIAGTEMGSVFWNHVGAFPIAVLCALTALALFRSRAARGLRSRPLAVAVFACHSLTYAARAFVLPVAVSLYGTACCRSSPR